MQERPPNDALYVRTANPNPKKSHWLFHGMLIFWVNYVDSEKLNLRNIIEKNKKFKSNAVRIFN